MFFRPKYQRHLCWLAIAIAAQSGGCSREYYRKGADRETYQAIGEKVNDPRWQIPMQAIDPPTDSRLHDATDPDFPPLPPDDPVAHTYMHCVYCMEGSSEWHDCGDAAAIENSDWLSYLDRSENGEVVFSPEKAVELGLINSREYQFELERLYLDALRLTLERFEFDTQWFGRNTTTFNHSGTGEVDGGNETNTLTSLSDLGFSRKLSSGGELMVNLANTLVWQFTGDGGSSASSNIVVELMQPLLRQAGRTVRLESLTQQEREVLYSVRRFARFRRSFYFDLTTGPSGFLSLLLQQQNIRNLEANMASLKQNHLLYLDRLERQEVSEIQVDQVFQSYQQGQLALQIAEVSFKTALDGFKIRLGLPPTVPARTDDSLLAPFQLHDPAVTALQAEIITFLEQHRQEDEQLQNPLGDGWATLKAFHTRTQELVAKLEHEFARWTPQAQAGETNQERLHYEQFKKQIAALRDQLHQQGEKVRKASLAGEQPENVTKDAMSKLSQAEHDLLSDLFIIQNQVRVYQITLTPVDIGEVVAIDSALSNRLDLKNERGRVVDAWRAIAVAANDLESNLDVTVRADIATDPGGSNPVRFSAKHSTYTAGLRFDGPLNRQRERNVYRTAQISYQRARRGYMALKDEIAASIRDDLRQLETNRLNFGIARQSLIVAARQVEQTREQLLLSEDAADSSGTQDILRALNDLLQAKTTLVTNWINYESARIKLEFDLEELELGDSLNYR